MSLRLLGIACFTVVGWAGTQPPSGPSFPEGRTRVPCDSTRAARLVLDSVERAYGFQATVLRFERRGARVRIVTQPANGRVLDGMAVAEVTATCRIARLTPVDST